MTVEEVDQLVLSGQVEQEERLRLKDEEEARKMEELRAKAKKELDDW
jgi:hypothetical protein